MPRFYNVPLMKNKRIHTQDRTILILLLISGFLHSESVSPICSRRNFSSASLSSGVSGGSAEEDLLLCFSVFKK